jgi:hypothetical protein
MNEPYWLRLPFHGNNAREPVPLIRPEFAGDTGPNLLLNKSVPQTTGQKRPLHCHNGPEANVI